MSFDLLNAVAGLGVGILVGMTGVGGGSLMAPIMLLVFGVAPATAVGTDLWFAAITKIFGGWVHGTRGTVDWQILRRLFYGSLPAALLTLAWLHYTGADQYKGQALMQLLGATLILTSVAAFARKQVHAVGARLRQNKPIAFKSLQPALTVAGGAVVGAVILLYLYPRRLTPSSLVGTDIVHAIPLTLVAGTGHLLMGNVDFTLLINLLAGSVPGILIGSLVAVRAPAHFIRAAIAIVLALVGVKLLTV